MKSNIFRQSLACILALVLLLALCPMGALAKNSYTIAATTHVQVIYATPEGTVGTEQVAVDIVNNIVSPNPAYVPEGHDPVNANPVKLIFDAQGTPIPQVIYFTYQKNDASSAPAMPTVTVNYSTVQGVFATSTVYVSPNANVITPDPALIPEGYLPFGNNRAIISFDENGRPTRNEVTFFYYLPGGISAPTYAPTATPQPAAPSWSADQITSGWTVPGQTVWFGYYEQDNNLQNGQEPVEWYVLQTYMGRALLLSRHALLPSTFHTSWTEVSWQDCQLRSWLNNNFYNECFGDREKQAILQATLVTKYVDSNVVTQDRVFLLEAAEAKAYPQWIIQCKPTAYSKGKSTATDNGYCYWWLRDTTTRKSDANRVYPNGSVSEYGGNTNATGVGVRPAIWVDVLAAFGK